MLRPRTLVNPSVGVESSGRPKREQPSPQDNRPAPQRRRQTQDSNSNNNNNYDDDDELDWYHQDRLVAPTAATRHKANGAGARLAQTAGHLDEYDDNDGNSSISLAQSGYQANLSAWRQRQPQPQPQPQPHQHQQQLRQPQSSISALDKADARHRPINRPTSVLSNSSSVATKRSTLSKFLLGSSGRKSNGSTSQRDNRIPLGPRSAQHFVTNSRRRRRANELILEALEARRRALAIGRQNAASLYGSASYLGPSDPIYSASPLATRLSLTPSPLLMSSHASAKLAPSHTSLRSPSPGPARAALSDLGCARQKAHSTSRISADARKTITTNAKSPTTLAKLDQNSSDLCTSNSSSESNLSQISSSDESQFTQLVTSDLVAPDYTLGQHKHLANNKPNVAPKPTNCRPNVLASTRPQTEHDKPKVAKRSNLETKMNRSQESTRVDSSRTATPEPPSNADKDAALGLRRGALNRDSIRRLRMSGRRASGSDAVQQPDSRQSREAPDLARPRITVAQSGRSKSFDESSVSQIRKSQRREQPVQHDPSYPTRIEHREQATQQNREPVRTDEPRTPKYSRSSLSGSSEQPLRESAASIKEMERIFNQVKPTQQAPIAVKRMESYTTSTSSLYQYKKETRMLADDRLPATTYFTVRPNSESNIRNAKVSTVNKPIPNPRADSSVMSTKYEDKILKEKTTTTSRQLTTISPPLEFADPKSGPDTRYPTSPEPIARLRAPNQSARSTFDSLGQDNKALNPAKPPVQRNDSPKFEPTANDELRKRVDQLARVARSKATSLADEKSQPDAPPAPKLVRPLSTNWPPQEPQETPREQAATNKPKPPTSPKPRLITRTPASQRASLAATTNLDSVLMFPKEQESGKTHFEWRRSSSNLAAPQSSQIWPQSGLQSSSASNLDEPKQETQVMKLMVREKRAPRLDYAIVEKQPVSLVQEAREVNPMTSPPSATNSQPIPVNRRQQPLVVGSGPMKQASTVAELSRNQSSKAATPSRLAPNQSTTTTTTNEPDRSRLSLQHPRQFNASSRSNSNSTNDDSAIASSISSPSLSANQISLPTTSSNQSTPFAGSQRRQPTQVSASMPGILRQRQLALAPQTRLEQYDPDSQLSASPRQYSSQSPSHTNQQQTSSNQKRVHFNDRASVRSFESLSSLASESTAVPNEACEQVGQTGPYQLQARQQLVNSPDSSSLCSSSVGGSRLSAESPDIRCLKLSEAAIYAVREDPELDDPQDLVQVHPGPAVHPYVSNFAHQNQAPMSVGPIGYRSPPIAPPQRQAYMRMPTSPGMVQPVPRMGPGVGYPSLAGPIGTHHQLAACQPQLTSSQVPSSSGLNRTVDDDEDMSYADQLRRANNRVFSQFGSHQSQQPFQASINRRSLTSGHDIDNLQTEV